MEKEHPDAAAIDRLTVKAITDHLGISRQAVSYWRKHGVPKYHRRGLVLLGFQNGIDLPEMLQMRDRRTSDD